MGYFLVILLLFLSCNEQEYSDYSPLTPSDCEFEDITGICCSTDHLDCNNICNGNSELNCNNLCVSISYIDACNGCNDINALNYNENSTDDYNCIYDNAPENYTLVWNDEFNSPEIDLSRWNFETWGAGVFNNEDQAYSSRSDNSYIEDGKLIIKALKENYNGADYSSARLTTQNKGDWTYGRMEIRAKLPTGLGTWPAIWMMPTNSVYGGWPNSGEIDIMEHIGCDNGNVHGTIHCNEYNFINNTQQGGSIDNILANTGSNVDEFHTYSIEWNENSINWYVDNINYFTYNKSGVDYTTWPFDQSFFIILNLAIGGDWGGICSFESTSFPQILEIEYVRVYQ